MGAGFRGNSYNVQYRVVGTTTWSTGRATVDSLSVSGLTSGTNYEWQVQTACTSGNSAFTASTNFTTVASCGTAIGMSTANITTNSATFKWTPVSGAIHYNVQYRIVGTTTWTTGATAVDSFYTTGLTASSNYEWQVQTVCSAGSSAFTASTDFTTSSPPCNSPSGMVTANITTTSATFKWTIVLNALSYNVQYRIVGTTTWSTGTTATDSFNAAGLTVSSNYEWQVQTVCTGGSSSFTTFYRFHHLVSHANRLNYH